MTAFIAHYFNPILQVGFDALLTRNKIASLILNYTTTRPALVIVEEAADYTYLPITIEKLNLQYKSLPPLIVVTALAPQAALIKRALICGCRAYIHINDNLAEKLPFIFQHILEGGYYFSPSISPKLNIAHQHKVGMLENLSDFERTVLEYYFVGLSGVEVAETLGKPPMAIYKAMARTRKKFSVSTDRELFETLKLLGINKVTIEKNYAY